MKSAARTSHLFFLLFAVVGLFPALVASSAFAQEAKPASEPSPQSPMVYRVGGGVTAPIALKKPAPPYSNIAERARWEGVVVLYAEIWPDGRAHNVRVRRSLGYGLDENAIRTVTKEWRFKPGEKDGVPVAVAVNIEISFNL